MNFSEEFPASTAESVSRCTKNTESYSTSGCFTCGMCNKVFKAMHAQYQYVVVLNRLTLLLNLIKIEKEGWLFES